MQTTDSPVLRDIVLVGGDHSHVGVLRRFAMNPLPGARLTVICTDTDTPYSGMLPGYTAGHYRFHEVHIDLRRLAVFPGRAITATPGAPGCGAGRTGSTSASCASSANSPPCPRPPGRGTTRFRWTRWDIRAARTGRVLPQSDALEPIRLVICRD